MVTVILVGVSDVSDVVNTLLKVEVEANTRVFLARANKQQEARGQISLWRILLACFGSAYFQVSMWILFFKN